MLTVNGFGNMFFPENAFLKTRAVALCADII
jgi:hypothetical protein